MKYQTDPTTRAAIDVLLKSNAKRQSNLGIDSTDEERERAKRLWKLDLELIKELDEDMYEILKH